MNEDFKKAIVDYMFENKREFQLVNKTNQKFRQYIYTEKGEYCFGGEKVSKFIDMVDKLIRF